MYDAAVLCLSVDELVICSVMLFTLGWLEVLSSVAGKQWQLH